MECNFCDVNAAFEDGVSMCAACLADLNALAKLRKLADPPRLRFNLGHGSKGEFLVAISRYRYSPKRETWRLSYSRKESAPTLSAAAEAALKAWEVST